MLIGITLGVTGGSAFTTLLVALSFHQFFEGFAIGSAVVDAGLGPLRSMLMGLAYAVTTPIGIAIGGPHGLLIKCRRMCARVALPPLPAPSPDPDLSPPCCPSTSRPMQALACASPSTRTAPPP